MLDCVEEHSGCVEKHSGCVEKHREESTAGLFKNPILAILGQFLVVSVPHLYVEDYLPHCLSAMNNNLSQTNKKN